MLVVVIFQYSPLVLFHIISAFITGALAVTSWRSWKSPVSKSFTAMMAAATIWTAGSAIQAMSPSLWINILAVDIEYFGIVTVPVTWFFIILHYTGAERYAAKKTLPLFFAVPALTVIMVITNPLHHLFYESFVPILSGGSVIWYSIPGPFFWIHAVYSLGLLIFGIALIVSRLNTTLDYYRSQLLLLLVASGIPVIFSLMYLFNINPVPGFDLTPVMFTISGLVMALGVLWLRLFSLIPVAHFRIFQTMTDGVLVTGSDDLVVDINPAAAHVLCLSPRDAIGKPVNVIFPEMRQIMERTGKNSGTVHDEIPLPIHGVTRYFDAACVPLGAEAEGNEGRLIILRDISDRKQAEIALEAANRKLNLMYSITRHDILNKITALNCYLDLSGQITTAPAQNEYIKKEKEITGIIVEQIEFTGEYQKIGIGAPVWQDLEVVLLKAASRLDLKSIRLVNQLPRAEVFADPLFEKVFYNLIDNAIRYGGKISTITFSEKKSGNEYVITCEDDGEGIPAEDKSRLFVRGFGKNTGLGLFLSREILAITGITIAENGVFGQGARFEIRVPAGLFREKTN